MGRRAFTMHDLVEIWSHWYAGDSLRALERNLGVDRHTLRKYIAHATAAGLSPGGPPRSRSDWVALARTGFPDGPLARPQPAQAALAPYRDRIAAGLAINTVATVWQRLVADTALTVSLRTFRRYCAGLAAADPAATVTLWRPDPPVGTEAQVDYGLMGRWTDPRTQQSQRIWAFSLVLTVSRHLFVNVGPSQAVGPWCAAHVAAFTFFDGVPHRIVRDNLKDGVLRPDLYDPQLNRTYADLAAHYGFLIDPGRVAHPKDKARVERGMPYIRDSFWRGRRWTSVAQMNEAALRWCREVAGQRVHGTTHARPLEVFTTTEQPALHPLPTTPWVFGAWTTARVGPDSRCHVARALYSVPWAHVGRRLDVRLGADEVAFFWQETCVKIHRRVAPGQVALDLTDYPAVKRAYYERTPAWCRTEAQAAGTHVMTVVDALLATPTTAHLRQAQGIVGLLATYGASRVDAACQRAWTHDDPRLVTIRNILAQALDQHADPLPAPTPPDPGALLRGPDQFTTTPVTDPRS